MMMPGRARTMLAAALGCGARARAGVAFATVTLAVAAAPACGQPCCTLDGQPVPLSTGASGALYASVVDGDVLAGASRANPHPALIDTGFPLSLWSSADGATAGEVNPRTFTFLDATVSGPNAPVRGVLRNASFLGVSLGTVADGGITPMSLMGGDLLSGFSVDFAFTPPAMTFWDRQPADDGFLSAWGYAVLHLDRLGGGQIDADGLPDFLGLRGPYDFSGTRLLLRTCAAPDVFAATDPLPSRCCTGDVHALGTGTDLALVFATGMGPLVLSRSSWQRVAARLAPGMTLAPTGSAPIVHPSQTTPIAATHYALPRLALVDQQADDASDPGPCAELARAHRLEQVDRSQAGNSQHALCAPPCDQDPRSTPHAQDSAGYLALEGALDVAVIDDAEPYLQVMRAEVRPEGPEIDGVFGVAALAVAGASVEVDYKGPTVRAVFSCPARDGVPSGACRAVGSCPRLGDQSQTHVCFGLPSHGLPQMCDNPSPTCP